MNLKAINVVSMYDGMSCGYVSFKELGIPINRYVATEIDKYPIKTSKYNFPNIEHIGDAFANDYTKYKGFDWVIGGSPCFTKGHLVLTDKGYKDISEVEIGDMVLTHKNRYRPVTRLYKKEAKTVNLKIQGYPVFVTTLNHPFYTINRMKNSYKEFKQTHTWRKFSDNPTWTKVSDMTKDTFCGYHIHTSLEQNVLNLTEEECFILGRYVADGHIRNEKRKGRKNSLYYQLILSIGKNKINDFQTKINENHYSCYPHTQSVYRCVFSSKRLVEIAKMFGTKSSGKYIPNFVYDLPKELVGSFIEGYLSGDGYTVKNSDAKTASTVSPKLAFGLQRLISSYYHVNVGVNVENNNREHKIDGRIIKSNYPLYGLFFKENMKKQSVAHIQNNIIWNRVMNISPTDKSETVYNIEVSDDNSYTVNNCIVHNCTHWTIAQKNNRETKAEGIGWELFCQYVRAIKEVQPKYFLYENNKSMSDEIKNSISKVFGFEPIFINSSLVSAQNRKRLYWVGIRNQDGTYRKANIKQPKDRGILLQDILEDDCIVDKDKAYVLKHQAGNARDYFKKHHTQVKFERVRIPEYGQNDKSRPLNAYYSNNCGGGLQYRVCSDNPAKQQVDLIAESVDVLQLPYELAALSDQYYHGDKDTDVFGKIECNNTSNNGGQPAQGTRIYNTDCKSICLDGDSRKYIIAAIPTELSNGKIIKAMSQTDGKIYPAYYVENGFITIKGVQYPIKLPDGCYIVRKLTVKECMRLQTIPEWYKFPVSDTRAYKMLGNGWTVEVIKHLIQSALNDNAKKGE